MKNVCKWMVLIVVAAVAVPVSAVVEDFTAGTGGQPITNDGWVTDGYGDASDWVFDTAGGEYDMAARNTAGAYAKKSFANPITDADEDVYLRLVISPETSSIFVGLKAAIPVMVNLHHTGSHLVRVYTSANKAYAEDSGYTTIQDHTYEVVIQMKNINDGNYGMVYIRDLSAGETEFSLQSFTVDTSTNQAIIPMGFTATEKPSTWTDWHLRSFGSGYVDELELNAGIGVPMSGGGDVLEDFTTGTAGAGLSTDGWFADGYNDPNNWVFDTAGGEFDMAAKNTTGAYAGKSFVNPVSDLDEHIYLRSVIKVGTASIFAGVRNTDISHAVMVNLYYGNPKGVRVYNASGVAYVEDSGYLIQSDHTYETVIQMKNSGFGNNASVYIKDLTAGDTEFTLLTFTVGGVTGQETIPMGFTATERPATFSSWHLRSFGSGYVDEIGFGAGSGGAIDLCALVWSQGNGIPADLNQDCYVNLADFADMVSVWLACNDPENVDCQ